MLKIPFGQDKETGAFKDARSVKKGLACNCKCHSCGMDLEAVHPKFRVKHFRHSSKRECTGAIESLFHKLAKQILKENDTLKTGTDVYFHYSTCELEQTRYGKRPDAFLGNGDSSLIVEIYFTHETANEALEVYLNNNERVLEVDISATKMSIFDYEHLKEMILTTAPRKLLTKEKEIETKEIEKITPEEPVTNWGWLWWVLFGILTLGVAIYCSNRKRRRRRKY